MPAAETDPPRREAHDAPHEATHEAAQEALPEAAHEPPREVSEARPREESVDVIQRELTAFARRARAAAARVHPEIPLVSYTLLSHIEERRGCRATDLAAHYLLDKSTVSRQLAGLEKLGLVERRPAPEDHRVQVLHPTEAGLAVLATAQANRLAAYQERLKDWSGEDLARFAHYLLRYNSADPGGLLSGLPDPR